MANKFGFDKVLKNFEQLKKDLPKVLANDGLKHFVKSFNDQGFTDEGVIRWPEVQRRKQGTRAYERASSRDRTRAILAGRTSRLRRAVNSSIRQISFDRTVFSVEDVSYARRHNEGLNGMPKRQFMGRSKKLERNFETKIKNALGKIFPR